MPTKGCFRKSFEKNRKIRHILILLVWSIGAIAIWTFYAIQEAAFRRDATAIYGFLSTTFGRTLLDAAYDFGKVINIFQKTKDRFPRFCGFLLVNFGEKGPEIVSGFSTVPFSLKDLSSSEKGYVNLGRGFLVTAEPLPWGNTYLVLFAEYADLFVGREITRILVGLLTVLLLGVPVLRGIINCVSVRSKFFCVILFGFVTVVLVGLLSVKLADTLSWYPTHSMAVGKVFSFLGYSFGDMFSTVGDWMEHVEYKLQKEGKPGPFCGSFGTNCAFALFDENLKPLRVSAHWATASLLEGASALLRANRTTLRTLWVEGGKLSVIKVDRVVLPDGKKEIVAAAVGIPLETVEDFLDAKVATCAEVPASGMEKIVLAIPTSSGVGGRGVLYVEWKKRVSLLMLLVSQILLIVPSAAIFAFTLLREGDSYRKSIVAFIREKRCPEHIHDEIRELVAAKIEGTEPPKLGIKVPGVLPREAVPYVLSTVKCCSDSYGFPFGVLVVKVRNLEEITERYRDKMSAVSDMLLSTVRQEVGNGAILLVPEPGTVLAVLPFATPARVSHEAESLKALLNETSVVPGGTELKFEADVGYSCYPEDGLTDPEQIVRRAMERMLL